MLDPLTALGIAGNILQVVDCGLYNGWKGSRTRSNWDDS
jgi:hypothetical protein